MLSGGAEGDILNGGNGNDHLFGNFQNPQFPEDDGDDILNGGDGDDHLVGNGADDTLNGGAGNDSLTGGQGSDLFEGGPGTDTAVDTGELGENSVENT